jgi:hypothetical protein
MPLTGDHGSILINGRELPHVRQWRLRRRSASRPYASSATAGQTRRLPGRRDWSVAFEFDGHDLPIDEGDRITLRLYVDRAAGRFYQGQAVIDTIEPVMDLRKDEPLTIHVRASADGALTPHV